MVSKKIREGACAHHKLGFLGVNGVPLHPDPNPRVGQGRGPPGQSPWRSRGYSLGNSKNKKINTFFFGTGVNSGLLHKS